VTPELLTPTPDRKNPRPRNPAHPARQPGHSHTRTPESAPRDEAKPRIRDHSPTNHGLGSEGASAQQCAGATRLITGAYNRSAIGTLVERSSRFTILLHLPDGRHTADLVRDALVEAFTQLPAAVRRSLTWDQGKEMALHAQVAGTLEMPVFFCQKASPWQRPSNENTNGAAAAIFSEGHRSARPQRRADRRGGRRTQHPPPQDPRLANTRRTTHPTCLRLDSGP